MPAKPRQKALPPIKCGAVVIRRYQLADGRVAIAFPGPDGKRRMKTYSDEAKGHEEATRIARDLHTHGAGAEAKLSAEDRADFSLAKRAVAPFSVPVHVAAHEWSLAKSRMQGLDHPLERLVRAGVDALRETLPVIEDVRYELDEDEASESVDYLYLFRSGGPVKIGISSHVERRRREIEACSPWPVECLGSWRVSNAALVEQSLHYEFGHRRIHREWFHLSEDEISMIKRTMDRKT